ncbi:MAG TPA: FCD domain-containing protein [Amycolatopsis sp.]|nr:FCD domain-containing protein [Amycolatopsis sp.]
MTRTRTSTGSPARGTTGRAPKLAERVARSIEDDIVGQGWPVGRNLGSEAALMERFGVSRAIFREAAGILEYKQVAAMQRGRGGGLVVRAPAAAVVAHSVAAYFAFAHVSVEELYETRVVLQVLAGKLAARRITEADVVRLRAMTEQPGAFHEGFEVVLGKLSRNPALAIFIPTLMRVTGMIIGAPSGLTLAPDVESARRRGCRAIVDAIVSGDESAIQRRMTRYLDADRAWVLDYLRRHAAPAGFPVTGTGKLAEQTALVITREIRERGHQPETVIGSEPELLARLRVGRSVFRQAVRILEHNGIARMRQGATGGLVATTPDPRHVVDALSLYLHYLKVDIGAVFETRSAIELATVAQAARHASDLDTGSLRQALLVAQAGDAAGLHGAVHVALAELAGNTLLTLFLAVLLRVGEYRSGAAEHADPDAHEAIAEAVVEGDASLARHRMARHLQDLAPDVGDAWPQ